MSEPGGPPASGSSFCEPAFAKINLLLHVGPPRGDRLHPLCSIFASLELADDVFAEPTGGDADRVDCPGVSGTNLAEAALAAFREHEPSLPATSVRIVKRIPIAAGLGGGSADAAAVLRAANRIAGEPLDVAALRELAAGLGSDVPSQVEPGHALVRGTGELVEPIDLPPLAVVLVPQPGGLATADVYARLDRMEGWRHKLDPEQVRGRFGAQRGSPGRHPEGADLSTVLENDLQPAALALRPELATVLDRLHAAGALGAQVSGSGPTCFGLFADRDAADSAAADTPHAIVTRLRQT